MKSLGVTSLARTPLAPDIPAIAEELPGFETILWYGLVAPAGTPRHVVDRLHDAVSRSITKPDVKTRLGIMGFDVAPMNPDQFADYIKSEIAKWSREAKEAGIQPE
jgi:tripartite-type tricarboxylate transporter receptor subunit TctC